MSVEKTTGTRTTTINGYDVLGTVLDAAHVLIYLNLFIILRAVCMHFANEDIKAQRG